MSFDLDTNNYSKDDYFEIFNLDKNMNPSMDTVEKNYKNLLNNVDNENLDGDEKNKMKQFLTECKNNLKIILNAEKSSYKLINSDFTPTLEQSETYQTNSNFIIKKNDEAITIDVLRRKLSLLTL